MRDVTLTAYGKAADRERLAVLAADAGQSVSTWIVLQIRREYARQYGDVDPATLRKTG